MHFINVLALFWKEGKGNPHSPSLPLFQVIKSIQNSIPNPRPPFCLSFPSLPPSFLYKSLIIIYIFRERIIRKQGNAGKAQL